MARVLIVVISLAITIYAVADIARTPSDELPVRIPKPLWLLLVILLTPLGGLAWIIVSRVTQAEARGGQVNRSVWYSDQSVLRPQRQNEPRRESFYSGAPDDDPDLSWRLEKQMRQKRMDDLRAEFEKKMDEAEGIDPLQDDGWENTDDLDTMTDKPKPPADDSPDTDEDDPDTKA